MYIQIKTFGNSEFMCDQSGFWLIMLKAVVRLWRPPSPLIRLLGVSVRRSGKIAWVVSFTSGGRLTSGRMWLLVERLIRRVVSATSVTWVLKKSWENKKQTLLDYRTTMLSLTRKSLLKILCWTLTNITVVNNEIVK